MDRKRTRNLLYATGARPDAAAMGARRVRALKVHAVEDRVQVTRAVPSKDREDPPHEEPTNNQGSGHPRDGQCVADSSHGSAVGTNEGLQPERSGEEAHGNDPGRPWTQRSNPRVGP